MLEIRRGNAARSYENTFFREFASNLEKLFEKYSIDGLLIANSECEASPNLKIDSLLITENAICLIDFKNYGGEVILPQADGDFPDGQWVTQDGTRIKGGSLINPYKQLAWQKRAFTWVFHNSSIKSNISGSDRLDPKHANKIVCFQKPIQLIGEIPGRDEIDFFITDPERYLEAIKDILDVEDGKVRLSQDSFVAFKAVFIAEPFSPAEDYKKQEVIDITSPALNYDGLYPDQKSALHEIAEFIKSDTDKVFIIQGTSLSGKSYLSPFIEDIGFNNNFNQIEFFASSSRVASNLLSEGDVKYHSIYSYIYGGERQDSEDEQDDIKQDDANDQTKLEVVPLKKSDNEDKALFIVDEAQLLSDNYHQSIDLRFGTGKLLHDFIKFSDLNNSNRKIIFLGDCFQISMAKKGESALNPSYLTKNYDLTTKAFQLVDKEGVSAIIDQILTPVKGIRRQVYNQLSFEFSNKFKKLDRDEILSVVAEKLENDTDFHILTYSNDEAQKVNLWIKQSILNNGEDLAPNDLVIFNNNFKIEDQGNPFSEGQKVFNGQFGTIINADKNIITEVVTPKGKQPVEIKFREVELSINDDQDRVAKVLSLENYRLGKRRDVSEDELIALKIILNDEVLKEFDNNPYETSTIRASLINSEEYKKLSAEISELDGRLKNKERVKTERDDKVKQRIKLEKSARRRYRKDIERSLQKDPSSKYFKYKNAAFLRFGWALTVHKSMSYKWDEVLFNVDPGDYGSRTNEGYFKWIYTGLARANENIRLINFRPITPLFKIKYKDDGAGHHEDKKIYFIADGNACPDRYP